MAITLFSPANSFIQFVSVDAPSPIPTISCGISFDTCLPITEGDDYKFQFYVEGELSQALRDNYVVHLKSQDDSVISSELTVDWFYDEVADRTWGFVTDSFNINDFADLGGCSNFIISKKTFNYSYDLTGVTYPDTMTISLIINGVDTVVGGGTFTDVGDIITVIQAYLSLQGYDAIVQESITNFINIQAVGGDIFGNMTIETGDLRTILAVGTSFLTDEYISNCLAYVVSTCFTSVVAYRGNENQFGFNYALDPTFYNSVRLPVWIDKPQAIDDETTFTLSDGSEMILAASYLKEYDGHTEYFDETNHFRFRATLKHDTLLLNGNEFVSPGKYDIGWIALPGSPILNAPASFKVRPTPYYQKNSNCVNV